jgi:hypothetical protein
MTSTGSIQMAFLFYPHSWPRVHRGLLKVAKNKDLLLCCHLLPIAECPICSDRESSLRLISRFFFSSHSFSSITLFFTEDQSFFVQLSTISPSLFTRSGSTLIQVSILPVCFKVNPNYPIRIILFPLPTTGSDMYVLLSFNLWTWSAEDLGKS